MSAPVATYDPYALIGDVMHLLTRAGVDYRFTGAEADAAVVAAAQLLTALGVVVARHEGGSEVDS